MTGLWNLQGDSPHGALLPVTAFTFEAPRVGKCSFGCHSTSSPSDSPQDAGLLHPR